MVAVVFCAAMMAALYQPFIVIWTKGNSHLIRHAMTPILMILYFYVMQSRQVLLSFKSAAALWRQDRWKPIVAGAVNLTSNILFVLFLPEEYKLDGVIASTIIGFAFIQIPWESHVVFTSFFGRDEARSYWRQQVRFAFLALALCAAAWGTAKLVPNGGFARLAAKGAASAVVVAIALSAMFRDDVAALLRHRKVAFAKEK
jgi:hypothetical protein